MGEGRSELRETSSSGEDGREENNEYITNTYKRRINITDFNN